MPSSKWLYFSVTLLLWIPYNLNITTQITTCIKEIDKLVDVIDMHYEQMLHPLTFSKLMNMVITVIQKALLCLLVTQSKKYKRCAYPDCQASEEQNNVIPKNKINCPYCKVNLKWRLQLHESIDSKGSFIPKNNHKQKPTSSKYYICVTSATILPISRKFNQMSSDIHANKLFLSSAVVNPCSYETVLEILRDIGHKSGTKRYATGDCEFTVVYCDGSLFNPSVSMVISTFQCSYEALSLPDWLKCRDTWYEIILKTCQ